MELVDWIEIGRVASETFLCDDVLTGIVTLGGTVPEEESTMEGW